MTIDAQDVTRALAIPGIEPKGPSIKEKATMIRNPHKMTLDERVAALEDASALLKPQSTISKVERARVRRFRDEVCISLIVDGFKQRDSGAWYRP